MAVEHPTDSNLLVRSVFGVQYPEAKTRLASSLFAQQRDLGSLVSAPQVTRIAVLLGCSLGISLPERC